MLIGLVIGLFLIGMGFLVKSNPYMLYYSMPAERIRYIDLESVGALYKKGMIAIGLVTIFLSGLFTLLNLSDYIFIAIIGPMIVGIVILIILVQKYDHYKGSRVKEIMTLIFVVMLVIAILVLLYYALKDTEVVVSKDNVEFKGEYGITVSTLHITALELWKELPKIEKRIEGIKYGNSVKGDFILEGKGECRLFVKKNNPPYIYIEISNGRKIVYNMAEPTLTREIHLQILHIVEQLERQGKEASGNSLKDKGLASASGNDVLTDTVAVVPKNVAVVSVKDSLKNTEVVFIKDKIKFTGEYGITISASLINNVESWLELPEIEKCIKGRIVGNSIKGDFTLKGKGDCRLFIKKNNPPYIYIELINGQKIVYNMTERLLTYKLLNQIWDAMDAC